MQQGKKSNTKSLSNSPPYQVLFHHDSGRRQDSAVFDIIHNFPFKDGGGGIDLHAFKFDLRIAGYRIHGSVFADKSANDLVSIIWSLLLGK